MPLVGVLNVQAAVDLCWSLTKSAAVAVVFMWVAHAFFPDPPQPAAAHPAPAEPLPELSAARLLAARSTLVVMGVMTWLLAISEPGYLAVALKSASMGQQASTASARVTARSLIASTVIGGAVALLIWLVLKVWPNLLMYTLLVLLAGLVMGRRVFAGPAFAPDGQTWSYAYVTVLIILGPAVLDGGDGAGERFADRIFRFLLASVYAVSAVWLIDGLFRRRLGPARA